MARKRCELDGNNILGKRLRHLIKGSKLTFAELSPYLSATKQSIIRWGNGQVMPSADSIKRIAEKFNVSADYLLGLEDFPTKSDKDMQEIIEQQSKLIDGLMEGIKSLNLLIDYNQKGGKQ